MDCKQSYSQTHAIGDELHAPKSAQHPERWSQFKRTHCSPPAPLLDYWRCLVVVVARVTSPLRHFRHALQRKLTLRVHWLLSRELFQHTRGTGELITRFTDTAVDHQLVDLDVAHHVVALVTSLHQIHRSESLLHERAPRRGGCLRAAAQAHTHHLVCLWRVWRSNCGLVSERSMPSQDQSIGWSECPELELPRPPTLSSPSNEL